MLVTKKRVPLKRRSIFSYLHQLEICSDNIFFVLLSSVRNTETSFGEGRASGSGVVIGTISKYSRHEFFFTVLGELDQDSIQDCDNKLTCLHVHRTQMMILVLFEVNSPSGKELV